MHGRVVLALVALCLALFAAVLGAGRTDAATASDCQVVGEGPFLYVDTVFPVTRVECSGVHKRLRIATTLTRDGAVVASSRRDCRNRSVCHLDFDASTTDVDGNQVYCLHTQGWVDNNRFVGEASRCEGEAF